ncbi:MAG: YbaY family lipoprotein [Acidobacteriota bacterium]
MRRHLLLILACVLSSWTIASAQHSTVSGTITYRERIALPSSASIEVTIEDVSRADAASTVIARERMTMLRQVPVPFEVEYETTRIEPTHRYAVRARIFDGDRLMFTTTDTTLVITQGHPSRVSLMLRSAGGQSSPPQRPVSSPAPIAEPPPLPPAAQLRNLPATFAGTLPCADCTGIRYQLNLMSDDTFALRMTYLGKDPSSTRDAVGSWVLSSDRRVLALKGDDGPATYFGIRDAGTLRKLDVTGQPIASGQPSDLHRMSMYEPIAFTGMLQGAYRAAPGGRTFTPCASGRAWPVAESIIDSALATAYQSAGRKAGEALLVNVRGHIQPGGGADQTFVIDLLAGVMANASCEPRFAAAPLDGTTWKLSWINGAPFAAPATPRNHPTLTFRADTPTFAGNGGCNRLAGRYELRGDSMALSAAGTMMACPGADATETAFKSALLHTRSYRIIGRTLELYGDKRQLLARFEGS